LLHAKFNPTKPFYLRQSHIRVLAKNLTRNDWRPRTEDTQERIVECPHCGKRIKIVARAEGYLDWKKFNTVWIEKA
jgi:DNA-directed RNA polymerase subunit RPC12/RpoP